APNETSRLLPAPEPAAEAMSNLKILYQLGAALGSSFNIDQVLEVIMDLVFETVKADRGFILLIDDGGELLPKVIRMRDETDGKQPKAAPKFHASRTIINHVLNTGQGVLSSNAMADRLFSKSKSVHDL